MEILQPGWKVTGTYHETCAQEGHCPFYYGRDCENGCRYFMALRIKEGKVNGVDLSGITVIYGGDVPHKKYADFMANGSVGGVYVSDKATEEQRKVLETLVTTNMGAAFMKKILGVKFVKIEEEVTDDSLTIKMPFGEMKMWQMKGFDGTPIRIENPALPPVVKNLKHCHAAYWSIKDYGMNNEYKDRSGTWADFVFEG